VVSDSVRRHRRQLPFASHFSFSVILFLGLPRNLSAEVEQATRRQVQGMQSSQQRNRERVLAQLLGMVCTDVVSSCVHDLPFTSSTPYVPFVTIKVSIK
uniref:Uncharacterized protein n=1 Tax=Bos mutus grunniens TaxID=30521 RepID=A0A8B9XK08_BOSMU